MSGALYEDEPEDYEPEDYEWIEDEGQLPGPPDLEPSDYSCSSRCVFHVKKQRGHENKAELIVCGRQAPFFWHGSSYCEHHLIAAQNGWQHPQNGHSAWSGGYLGLVNAGLYRVNRAYR